MFWDFIEWFSNTVAFPNFFWSRDEGKSVSTGQPPAATACPSVEAPLSSSFFFFSRTFTYGMRKLLWMLSWHESELHQPLFSHWKVSFGKSSRVRNVEPVGHQTWWWSCLIQKLLLRDPKNQNTCEKINNVWGHQKSKDEIWQQIIFFGKKWLSKSNQNVFWSYETLVITAVRITGVKSLYIFQTLEISQNMAFKSWKLVDLELWIWFNEDFKLTLKPKF